ncbi:MAG: UDP-N-acetylmuramoyl-tripeptide--D-alanyl-D-alanine ligase [Desulfobacteraceae bacterium]
MTAHFSCQQIVMATGGQLQQRGAWNHFIGISTDSRTTQTGQLFIPLKGERHDGHDFISLACKRGTGGVLVAETWWRSHFHILPKEVAVISVPDTLTALGDLARTWRQRFCLPLVAITGSCGKTTTKEMAAQIAAAAYQVLKNELNFNNLIGLPQTLLNLNATHQVVIVEMGMNRFGEIRRLAQIAAPTIGVLTNVYPAHTEGVGDIEGVGRAKAELLEALADNQLLIYNQDDQRLARLAERFPGQTLSFGLSAPAQVRGRKRRCHGFQGQAIEFHWQGRPWPVLLKISGLHHLYNSLAAAAVGLALGLPPPQIVAGLENFLPLDKRTQLITLKSGVHIINDSYNANPGSMAMALQTLADLRNQGRTVAALGDMLELGAGAIQAHQELGEQACRHNLDLLVAYGDYRDQVAQAACAAGMAASQVYAVASQAEGVRVLKRFLRPGDWLLVKGSRGMRMENLISALGA